MLEAAKEEIFSAPMVWTGEGVLPLAADPASLEDHSVNERTSAATHFCTTTQLRKNSCLGSARKTAAPHQGSACSNSASALGIREALLETRVRSRYTGKERDAESGLDDFDARYYASTLGRFMRPDEPLVDQQTGNPQSWNLYSYVRNNPLNNTDPSGNACVSNGNGGFKDDDSGGQTCAEANDPKNNNTPSAVVTAKAPPSADDQRILDFANDLNRYNIQNNTLKLFGASAAIGLTGGAACYYLCPAATVTTIGVTAARVAPLLPVVAGAIEKLQKLGISLQEANEIITSPESQKLVDNLNGGNINVIKEVGGQLVRITTNPEGTRIISAGLVRANQIANGIANGRFVPKQ